MFLSISKSASPNWVWDEILQSIDWLKLFVYFRICVRTITTLGNYIFRDGEDSVVQNWIFIYVALNFFYILPFSPKFWFKKHFFFSSVYALSFRDLNTYFCCSVKCTTYPKLQLTYCLNYDLIGFTVILSYWTYWHMCHLASGYGWTCVSVWFI